MGWILKQQYFRENLGFGTGGETGFGERHAAPYDGAQRREHHGQADVEQGEVSWPAEAPFHTPIRADADEARAVGAAGRDDFFFCNDGPAKALEQARAVAGDRDIRISGGANVIQQYLSMGVVDELEIALAPSCSAVGGDCSRIR
jgi:hypothetical protein